MRRLLLAVTLMGVGGCADTVRRPPPPPRTTPTLLERALLAGNFQPILRVADLPTDLRSLIEPWPKPIADPGGSALLGCVVVEGFASKRLILGGQAGDVAFALYEYGGSAGIRNALIIAHFEGARIDSYCEFAVPRDAISIEELRAAVPAHLFKLDGYACKLAPN